MAKFSVYEKDYINGETRTDHAPKIGVLTYTVKHRKTYDTLCLLKARGYSDVCVLGKPLHYKKLYQPYIEHRPELLMDIPDIEALCQNLGYLYREVDVLDNSFDKNMLFLICGAGILPQDFVQTYRVINAHPGYIPETRGLDSYKWAIYEQKRIGVTTHFLGEYVDAGEIIERKEIHVEPYDTFHSVAQRVYETEINMLVNAIKQVNNDHEWILPDDNVIHKRMPHELEKELFKRFEDRKQLSFEMEGLDESV